MIENLPQTFSRSFHRELAGQTDPAYGTAKRRAPYIHTPHLERDVWDLLAQLLQALPGALVQEAQGDVKRRAAPHLHRAGIAQDLGFREGRGGNGLHGLY